VTERVNVEIVIKEKGAKGTSKAIKSVGRSSNKAAKAVGVLVTALLGLAAFKGLINIASDAVKASAAFESYGVTLRALLGSQKEANKALDNFVQLSAKTPFSVDQIVSGATTLAAAALGNREKLEELTQTAANLAAVTGLSFQESASNLARALNAGIGAADLFRDKGVRALIESIQGIPDATKLSADEMENAFQEIFGAGGTFGNAAENLSNTLAGSLSNVGDAASVLQVEIGDALAPAVINAARQVFIPFLTSLKTRVEENAEAFEDLAADGIKGATRAFTGFILAGLTAVATIADLADFLRDAVGAFVEFRLQLANIDLAGAKGLNKIFLLSDESLAGFQERVDGFKESIDRMATGSREARTDTENLKGTLDVIVGTLGELNAAIDQTDFSLRPEDTSTDVDLSGAGVDLGPSPEALKAQASALDKINALTQSLVIKEAGRIEPLDAALLRLEQQRLKILDLVVATNDFSSGSEALALIAAEETRLKTQLVAETERQKTLQAEITTLLEQAVLIAPDLAEEIRAAADAALDAGGGLERVNDALESVKDNATAGLEGATEVVQNFGDTFSSQLQSGIGSALRQAITGEGVDAMAIMADIGASLMEDALSSALDGIFKGGEGGVGGGALAGLFSSFGTRGKDGSESIEGDNSFDKIGDFLGGGKDGKGIQVGSAITAGLGAGLSILGGALRETSTSISNDLIRSAATQSTAAATRGVIAGPTSIPIFQVGKSLEAAFGTSEALLAEILGAIRIGNAQSGGAGVGDPAALALETTTPQLT
jgi:hypothetical protein